MSLSGSLGAIPATAGFRRRFTSAIGAYLLVLLVKAYSNAAFFRPAMRASECWFNILKTRNRKRSLIIEKFRLSKRCKIPAVDDFASANFLTSILPLDILRGSCRAWARRLERCRGCSSVGRALEWHSRGQGF